MELISVYYLIIAHFVGELLYQPILSWSVSKQHLKESAETYRCTHLQCIFLSMLGKVLECYMKYDSI